jgi:uncharacterized protein (TIGR00297 family)
MPDDPLGRFAVALAVPAVFGLIARLLRAVTTSGAIAGSLIAMLLLLAWGINGFAALAAVFIFTWVATRAGHDRKQNMHIAERASGRDAAQVVANIGIAGGAALLALLFPAYELYLRVAAAAVMAEATADTVSSEIGQAFGGKPRLLTNWSRAEPGTDGGVTVLGTFSGAAAALLLAYVASRLLRLPSSLACIVAGAGFAGMMFDSLLGATLERGGTLKNNEVNLLSTAFAALLAIAVAML